MTNKILKMIGWRAAALMGVVGLSATSAFGDAQNLVWNKTANAGLKSSDACLDGSGNPATFADGDNITFNSHAYASTLQVTLPVNAVIGDLLFNVTNYLSGTKNYEPYLFKTGPVASATKIEKYGSGGITFQKGAHSFDCDVKVFAGKLTFTPPDFNLNGSFETDKSVIGSLDVPRTIYVGNGVPGDKAILAFAAPANKYLFCWEHQVPSNLSYVLNAGTLNFGTANTRSVVGRVVMKNGATIFPTSSSKAYSRTMFNDDIKVERGEVLEKSQISSSGYQSQAFFSSAGKRIVIDVDEVTSDTFEDGKWVDDGETDLLMDLTLCDSATAKWWADGSTVDTVTNTAWSTRSSWIKRGPGTITLQGTSAIFRSSYTGDVDIEDGSVIVMSGPDGGTGGGNSSSIGAFFADRRITIHENAKVHTKVFMLPNVDNPNNIANDVMTVVMSNGLFSVEHVGGGCNIHMFGDGDFKCGIGPEYGTVRYLFWLGGDNRFALNRPYTFKPSTKSGFAYNSINIDVRKNHSSEEVVTDEVVTGINHSGYSEFNVSRSSQGRGDEEADVILGVSLASRPNITVNNIVHGFKCGVFKSGDGILQLNKENTYNNDTIVDEGGFLIGETGSVRTNVIVRAGGYVGGTGKIGGSFKVGNVSSNFPADLTIEEGGGLLVNATNTTLQVLVNGIVRIPAKGHLHICNYDGQPKDLSVQGIAYPNVTENGSLVGTNNVIASQWTASVDGWTRKENKRLIVSQGDDGLLKVDYKTTGLCVIVK